MNQHAMKFELPQHIERYLAALSKIYARDGKRSFQEIIVNAQVRVHEAWSSDNWNGGTYGHALFLRLPESLYLNSVDQKESIQDQLKEDLNKTHHFQNEFIEDVFLEMDVAEDNEWRRESGLLISGQRVAPPNAPPCQYDVRHLPPVQLQSRR